MHDCVHADGSMTGLSLQMSLQSVRPDCVQEFCAVALQFSSQSCMHSSSGDSVVSIFGDGVGVACTTAICCGALICGSRTGIVGSVFGASICVSMTGLVTTSCVAGAQLMSKISASIAHFITRG